jgi:hypothetical protein
MRQAPQPGPACSSAMGPLVQRGYLWSQPYRVVKGPRRDHRPDADLASAPGHAAPEGTRGNDPTHRGRLLFAPQSVAVALRLGQSDYTHGLRIAVRRHRRSSPLVSPKGIPDAESDLAMRHAPPKRGGFALARGRRLAPGIEQGKAPLRLAMASG